MESLILTWMFVNLITCVETEGMRLELSFNVLGPDNKYRALPEILIHNNSADRLEIICTVADGPVHRQVDSISIYRLSGNDINTTVATIQSYTSDGKVNREPHLISHDISGTKAVGSLLDEIPYLGVSIQVSGLTCEFSAMYRCALLYSIKDGSREIQGTTSITRNIKLSVNPSTLSLTVIYDDEVAISNVKDALYGEHAALKTGAVIKLKCTANIGTRTHAVIRWKTSTNFVDGSLLPYKPRESDHTKGSAGLINGSTCLYEKTDIVKYTITDGDSARPLTHPLQFQCYVLLLSPLWETPESSRKSVFVSAQPMTAVQTPSITTGTSMNSSGEQVAHVQESKTSSETVAIYIGIVIGVLAALSAIIAPLLLMRKYKIRFIMLCEDRSKDNAKTCKVKATLNPVYSISSTSSESSITTTETQGNYEDLNDESTCQMYETLHEYHEIDDLQE